MPIVSTDLVAYGAADRPEDDVASSGGAIDATDRPDLIQFTGNAVVAVISTGTDARTVTVTGRLATGALDSEGIVLNNTSEVLGALTFERLLKVVLSGTDGTETVTVKQGSGGATRATILPNQIGSFAMFIDSASESGITVRFEKIFWKNEHGTLSLTTAEVELTADPSSIFFMGIETAKDDTVAVSNRLAVPSNPTFVDDSVAQSVPTGDLAAGEAIGTWLRMTLAADAAALKTSFTTQLAGNTV